MVTKVRGSFEQFEGSAYLDFEDPTRSTANVAFSIASIATGQTQRDEHLRTNDFFDAATYPEGRFVSTSVTAKAGGVLISERINLEFDVSAIKVA